MRAQVRAPRSPTPRARRAGESLNLAVTLGEPASGTISVEYQLGAVAPCLLPEYGFQDGGVTFAAGDVAQAISVQITTHAYLGHDLRINGELGNPYAEAVLDEWRAMGSVNGRSPGSARDRDTYFAAAPSEPPGGCDAANRGERAATSHPRV